MLDIYQCHNVQGYFGKLWGGLTTVHMVDGVDVDIELMLKLVASDMTDEGATTCLEMKLDRKGSIYCCSGDEQNYC